MESLEGKRKIRAPVKDWLTQPEVLRWFDISESLLADWIARGLFPRPVPWTGRSPRWRWIDCVFREAWLEIESRLNHIEDSDQQNPEQPRTARQGVKRPD